MGNGSVLLFPNLQASHSKEAESTGLFINPDWNKVDIAEAFGWQSLLCHNRELFWMKKQNNWCKVLSWINEDTGKEKVFHA